MNCFANLLECVTERKLINDASMNESKSIVKCTLLGAGTSRGIPTLEKCILNPKLSITHEVRHNPSLLIQVSSKAKRIENQYIIDVGKTFRSSIMHQLARNSVSSGNEIAPNLSGVFLSHSHSDALDGLDDLREFNSCPIFSDKNTLDTVMIKFPYLFTPNTQGTMVGSNTLIEMKYFTSVQLNKSADIVSIPMHHGNCICSGYSIRTKSSQILYLSDLQSKDHLNPLSCFVDINSTIKLFKSLPIKAIFIDALFIEKNYPSHLSWKQSEIILKLLEECGITLEGVEIVGVGLSDEITYDWWAKEVRKINIGLEGMVISME